MIRLGILGSTRGTDMLALIAAINANLLDAVISIVASNKSDAVILKRAKEHGLPAVFVDRANKSPSEFDAELSQQLITYQVDLVVLIGYMKILTPSFIEQWRHRVINVHPSLLPAFAGGMNNNVHQAVLDAKIKETGCTVHQVTEQVDAGPILLQKKCKVLVNDTVETLKQRVQALEGQALIEVINQFARMKP